MTDQQRTPGLTHFEASLAYLDLKPTPIDGMHRLLGIRSMLERDESCSGQDSHPGGEVLG